MLAKWTNPEAIKNSLMDLGIPEADIVINPSGSSTMSYLSDSNGARIEGGYMDCQDREPRYRQPFLMLKNMRYPKMIDIYLYYPSDIRRSWYGWWCWDCSAPEEFPRNPMNANIIRFMWNSGTTGSANRNLDWFSDNPSRKYRTDLSSSVSFYEGNVDYKDQVPDNYKNRGDLIYRFYAPRYYAPCTGDVSWDTNQWGPYLSRLLWAW